MVEFPKDFFWGGATAAHQVEGNNINSDWWEWEKAGGAKEPSSQACQHYQFFKQDFDLAKELYHNCHRFSVEWSRIQPAENEFSASAIQHYKEVILALRERGLEPIVTLHHFTNPLWLAKSGGWLNPKVKDYFSGYVEKVVEELSDKVTYWVTINEPMVYVYHAYIRGWWPPQEKSFSKAEKVKNNLARAHIQAYKLIHAIYKKRNLGSPQVSIAHNMVAFTACSNNFLNSLSVYLRDRLFNQGLLRKLIRSKTLDFIGINYYTRNLIDSPGRRIKNFLTDLCAKGHNNLKKNSLGWEIYPQGLYKLLLSLKKYKLPLFILENGICTADDNLRWEFIVEHLKSVYRARKEGCDVRSYIYWSLLDNFEWDKGFVPRFGLIEVDYSTFSRTVRESARKFSAVCKNFRLD